MLEKGLAWADDLVVIGERRDSVLVLDFDEHGARAGGGVLEAGSDDLEALERVATDVVGYLTTRLGLPEAPGNPAPPPEVTARRAAAQDDAELLARELARPLYPGHSALFASLSLKLGALLLASVTPSVRLARSGNRPKARVSSIGRGAVESERRAAWLAAAHAARAEGARALAELCEARAQ